MATLSPTLRKALASAVTAAATHMRDAGLLTLDHRKVLRYGDGPGSVRQSVESGFGLRSAVAVLKWITNDCVEFAALKKVLATEAFPTWLATPFSGSALQPEAVVRQLAHVLADPTAAAHGPSGFTISESAESLVDAFADLLASRQIRMRLVAHLENCAPLPEDLALTFTNGVTFRRLKDAEMEHLLAVDVLEEAQLHPFYNRSILQYDFVATLSLEPLNSAWKDTWPDLVKPVEQVHAAMHAFKSGSTPIAFFRVESLERTLRAGVTVGARGPKLAAYSLEPHELPAFESFVENCTKPCRTNLQLAKDRLRDAESRASAVDAIVDAFVGIEALLNSDNAPELTMRVALNYASLCRREKRQESYRKLKDLYRIRSKIVHGSYSLTAIHKVSGVSLNLGEVAQLSKDLLRELVQVFVSDVDLRVEATMDNAYWEARYFLD